MQNEGIKVAQPGFDVRTCKDYELIFNSSWPTLPIAFDKTIALTTNASGNASYPHNLGFIPLAMAWQFSNSSMTLSLGRIFPSVDKTNVYFSFPLQANTTLYFNIKCYNLNITIPQSYIYLQSAAVNTPYNSNYGIKVVKQNVPITSTDMRSFIIHSRCASPQVLAVVTQNSPFINGSGNNNNTLQFTNPQGYTPWAFGYAQVNNIFFGNIYEWAPPINQAYPKLNFSGGVITMQVNLNTNGSLVILRDPLFASNNVSAVY